MEQHSARQLEGGGNLGQGVPATLPIAVAHDQLAHDRDVTCGGDGRVQRQGLPLQLQLGVEVVADERMEQTRMGARAAL